MMTEQPQPLGAHDAIMLTMAAKGDNPIGRTALQKVIYFESLKVPASISYRPHYFGPFSKDVAAALEDLIVADCIDERVTLAYDHESYSYNLTKEWVELAREDSRRSPHYAAIKDVVDGCDEFCRLRPRELSHAAKAHYILSASRSKGAITRSDVKKTGEGLGWTISENNADRGFELLSRLGLVT